MAAKLTVRPVGPDRLDDLATLFGTTKTTNDCYCAWFMVSAQECREGWGAGNRRAFERIAYALAGSAPSGAAQRPSQGGDEPEPMGLLAYRGGEPVGWCATGPRSRYARALRSTILKARDPHEDPAVWLVPCFYVRRDARRGGVTRTLLEAAVGLARRRGAVAVEGFPLAGDRRRSTGEAFLGVEPLFASCGFTVVARPTAARVVMRRDLRNHPRDHGIGVSKSRRS